ncbi:putative Flagellar biosynthetic protein FlhB [uncultured Desulfobacterium sp.]|uniref:Flagellar biosynthetic protein FlhB n=1 Tax=uncultured Desulfobacterium sp. TaxID=201089 RepID=A0A445MTD2_9BACT|nr:putative Flagellar biosynthetic protein FlhB [uncultured Desulfobacterium sp.]
MLGKNDQDKTEKPSQRKLEKARNEGKIARTQEIPTFFILLSSLCILFLYGSRIIGDMCNCMSHIFRGISKNEFDIISMNSFITESICQIYAIIMPIMLSVLIAGVVGNMIQIGFVFTTKPFEASLSKLNPIKGIKNIISIRSIVELIKALLKCVFIGGIAYYFLSKEMGSFASLMQMDVTDILKFIASESLKICIYVCVAFGLLGIFDYVFQKWQHRKDLMMTKHELKEEARQSEGDPKIKGRIKQIQLENARRRMMQSIHEADIIITNPTRIAIALKYESKKMMAPKVLAKGAGYIAEKIKEIGIKCEIPIIENKPLARAIFKSVEIGEFIPVELYKAVAEVLAYVYKLRGVKNKYAASHICVGAPNMLWSDYCFSDRNELA